MLAQVPFTEVIPRSHSSARSLRFFLPIGNEVACNDPSFNTTNGVATTPVSQPHAFMDLLFTLVQGQLTVFPSRKGHQENIFNTGALA